MAGELIRTTVTFDANPLAANLVSLEDRLIGALRELGERMAAKMRTWAQQHAPWTDRTGHARQRLASSVLMEGARLVIILFHQESYGIWLEVAHNGRWAIIMRTINTFYPRVMNLAFRLVTGS